MHGLVVRPRAIDFVDGPPGPTLSLLEPPLLQRFLAGCLVALQVGERPV
jgi:hypothetical protein